MKGPPKLFVPTVIFPPEVKLVTPVVRSSLSCRVLKINMDDTVEPIIADTVGNQHFVPYSIARNVTQISPPLDISYISVIRTSKFTMGAYGGLNSD